MSKGSGVPGKTMFQQARSLGAAPRKAAREARTVEEQLSLLDSRPGNAKAERARLARRAEG